MDKTKSLLIMFMASNVALSVAIIILEVTDLKLSDLYPVLIVAGVINIFAIVYFFVSYYKNRGVVKKLQDEYINSLRPKVPLRFCASDSELLKTYDEAVKTDDANKLLKVIAINKEPEEEREM